MLAYTRKGTPEFDVVRAIPSRCNYALDIPPLEDGYTSYARFPRRVWPVEDDMLKIPSENVKCKNVKT